MHLHAIADSTLLFASFRSLLDRIDIQIEMPGLRYQESATKDAGVRSTTTRRPVNLALKIQLPRFDASIIHPNAQMGAKEIKRYYATREDANKLMETSINNLGLNARACSRVMNPPPASGGISDRTDQTIAASCGELDPNRLFKPE
jgi:magnesium chelatase family protein